MASFQKQKVKRTSNAKKLPNENKNIQVHVTTAKTQGKVRETMEDIIAKGHTHTADNMSISFVAVLDGHGGSNVAEFVAKRLRKEIPKYVHWYDMESSLERLFVNLQELTLTNIPDESGTTLSLACWLTNHPQIVWCANVGDSTIRLFQPLEYKTKRMSKDHKPHLREEQQRMSSWNIPYQIVDGYLMVEGNGLAMTRALGDRGHAALLSSVPHVTSHIIRNNCTLLLASDGFWENQPPSSNINNLRSFMHKNLARPARDILKWRLDNGPDHDNISIVAVHFLLE